MSVDGQPWAALRQPQRRLLFRRDRIILIEGDADSVPPGSFLRARWMSGMGLESSTDLGAPRDVRWVRAPFDLAFAIPFGRPRVDRTLSPNLIALCAAAEDRLVHAAHR